MAGKDGGCIALCKKVYKVAMRESWGYQSPTSTRTIMPPKRGSLRLKLDEVAAEDLKKKRKAKVTTEEEEEDEEEMEADEKPKKKKVQCEGSVMEGPVAVDKYGFSTLDGNKYLDDTTPSDFPDSFHFNEAKKSELGNKFFSVRWALLRGRSKKDGSLYSSPSIFLQKDWQGRTLNFTMPDKHVSALRKFLEEVENEKLSTL